MKRIPAIILVLAIALSLFASTSAFADVSQSYTRRQLIEMSGITIPADFAGNYDNPTTVTLYYFNTYSILRSSPEDGSKNNLLNIYYYFETDRQIIRQLSTDGSEVEKHQISYRVTVPQTAHSFGSYKGFSLILWNGCYGWIKNTGIYTDSVAKGREYTIDTIIDTEPVSEGTIIDNNANTPIEIIPANFNIRTAATAAGVEVPDDFIPIFETGTPIVLFCPNSFSYFRSAPDKDNEHILSIIYLNTDTSDKDHLRADCKQVTYYGKYDGYLLVKWNGSYGWVKDSGLSPWGDISGTMYNKNPASN